MALKGTTKIELTNVKTGEREVIEKDNLVTNAVPDLISLNPDGFLWDANYNFASNMLPICPNAIGGILLFENALEEDPAKYYAPDNNALVGYSSNDVNPSEDIRRGSLNQTESGKLEDGSGYRFVFDFATSQANGTISGVGLTSKWGGASGYGSLQSSEKPVVLLSRKENAFTAASTFFDGMLYKYVSIVGVSDDLKYGYYAFVAGQNFVEVGKIRLQLAEIPLVIANGAREGTLSESVSLETETFASLAEPGAYNFRRYNFMDDGDGHIWGFEHANGASGNSASPATLNYIKISKADFSFTEGTMEVDAKLYMLGQTSTAETPPTSGDSYSYSIIHDGYLYCFNYAKTGIVKINLSNPTDVKEILHPNGAVVTPIDYNYYHAYTTFNINGNVVYFGNGYIENDEIIPIKDYGVNSQHTRDAYPAGLKTGRTGAIRIGPYMIQYNVYAYSGSTTIDRTVFLMTPYLATINNLPTPVQKTADKTMKITYILREES